MGHRSRVPPARSARTGARTVTLFIFGVRWLLEECPSLRREFCQLLILGRQPRSEPQHASAELSKQIAVKWIGCDRFEFQRIEPRAAVLHPVVEMWTGGQTARSDVADHLSLHHLL